MKLAVPEALKQLLVDDWEAVTKNNQVRISPSVLYFPLTETCNVACS